MAIGPIQLSATIPGIGQAPTEITVTGQATNCASVNVLVRNDSNSTQTITKTVPVAGDGSFSASFASANQEFPAGALTCGPGQKLVVEVSCATDPGMRDSIALEQLDCLLPAQDCPSIGSITVAVADTCNPDEETRTVTVTAQAAAGNVAPAALQWYFVSQGPDSSEIPGASEVISTNTPLSYDHDLPGGDYTAELRVVIPQDCPPVTRDFTVGPCNGERPCPSVTFGPISVSDLCDDDDNRLVDMTVTVSGAPEDNLTGQLRDQDGNQLAAGSDDDGDGLLTLAFTNQAFPPGQHTISAVLGNEDDCGSHDHILTIAPCLDDVPCPSVSFGAVRIGDCDPDTNERPVSLSVEITGNAGDPLSGQLRRDDGVVLTSGSDDDGDGLLVLSIEEVDFPPGLRTISVVTGQEGDCGASEIDIDVQACCPDITMTQTVGACNDDGTRPVSVTATVSGAQGPVGATLRNGAGEEVDTATSQEASVNLADSRNLAPGTYTYTVAVDEPQDCTSESSVSVTVPLCDTIIDWCTILKFLILFGAGFFLLGIVLLLCPQGAEPLIPVDTIFYIALGLAALGLIILAIAIPIYVLLCRPTECDWIGIGWQVVGLAALVFIYIALCPACGNLGYIGAALAIIAVGLFWVWIGRCQPGRCRIFDEILLFFINADVIQGLETILASCVITTNFLGALLWWAALAVGTYIGYWGTRRFCRR